VSTRDEPRPPTVGGFRVRVLVAMMLVVSAITTIAVVLAERGAAAGVEAQLQREFERDFAALHNRQELRQAALLERCRALIRRPRIQAALEDNALDLLYPTAKDELRDLIERPTVMTPAGEAGMAELRAQFYRFLSRAGTLLPPPPGHEVGALTPEEEGRLMLPSAPERQQIGYFERPRPNDPLGGSVLTEVIALPIFSNNTGELLAGLVLGFETSGLPDDRVDRGLKSGIWLEGKLHLPVLSDEARVAIAKQIGAALRDPTTRDEQPRFTVYADGAPHLLFYQRLNPGSLFPPAYEVSLYPLAPLHARQRRLRWELVGAGALLLIAGLAASQFMARRLSVPVEKLARDSDENRTRRERAEAALELTAEELQRSARFSADASHQLKTPVAVLRAGLEELQRRPQMTPADCEEIDALIHQTYRLASVIEDLLLLSRIDAGRVQIDFAPVDLTMLVEAALDDLGALPDPLALRVSTEIKPGVRIAGEKRYLTLVLQNLLENARKYNRAQGRIRVSLRVHAGWALLLIGNTGTPVPREMHATIFERFHRGAMGENVPGHGLGLNLARELVRIHGGELILVRSDEDWTEFEASFRLA
jgi:signal transduction histidine kinase